MSLKKTLLLLIFAAFGAYSSWVMLEFGYMGIWEAGIANGASLQILLDLVIACLLICSWMIRDARDTGRNALPYVALTLAAGSFGPLIYLLVGEFSRETPAPALG